MIRRSLALPRRIALRALRALRSPPTEPLTGQAAPAPVSPASPAGLTLTASPTRRGDTFRYALPGSLGPLAFSGYPAGANSSALARELAAVGDVRAVFGVGEGLTVRLRGERDRSETEAELGAVLHRHFTQRPTPAGAPPDSAG